MAQSLISRTGGSQRGAHGQSGPAKQPSFSGSASFGYPIGYPGAPARQSSMNATGTVPRSQSRTSLSKQSRSLGASKASLANQKGKTTIQSEFHDKRVRHNIQSPLYGKGRTPCLVSIVFFALAGLLVLAGAVVLLLRMHNNIMLSIDKGEIIGPLLIAFGIFAIAGGFKFCYDAYIISDKERKNIRFTPANESLIATKTSAEATFGKPPPLEGLVSGSISANAVSRTPHGSLASLTHV